MNGDLKSFQRIYLILVILHILFALVRALAHSHTPLVRLDAVVR